MRPAFALVAAFLLFAGPVAAQDAAPPAGTAPPGNAAAPAAPANPVMTGPRLLISTSMGDITLQLDSVRAPKSVANVLSYAREKHYDGTAFYRVARGFVIQMGSFDANGKGRAIHPGPLAFEGANGLSNLRGSVALAHGDAEDSAKADFFINLDNNTALDHVEGNPDKIGYAVFAEVVSGMDVVDAIAAAPVGDNGPMAGEAPLMPIVISKVSILPEPK
jgi:cyclophilin family peptidyl-prolyl cis-trans isomerase